MQNQLCIFRFIAASLFLGTVLSTQSVSADQQNPLLTSNAIIVSQQGVYRFERESLKPEWQSLNGINTYQPVMGKQWLYVGSTQGLYALDPQNGNIVWHIEPDKTVFSPALADRLYAGSLHGELYAIDQRNGAIEWRRQLQGWTYSPVVIQRSGQLWTAGQSHQASLLDSESGQILHQFDLGQEAIFSPQIIDDRHIAINLFDGSSAIVDVSTASLSGRLAGSSQPKHLSSFGNTIYRSSRDGSLTAFDKLSHRAVWQERFVSSDLSLHPAVPGYILLTDDASKLLLVDLKQNKVVYQASLPGQWSFPVQVNRDAIVYFIKDRLQPNHLQAVKISAGST